MNLGFFTMPVHPLDRNYTETLKEDREAFILADQLGYSEGFAGEHLTDRAETITNSMLFLATLQSSTRQIRLGTGTANLAHTHPVLVAAHAAMLDHLLEGRFLFGISPGVLRSDAEALGLLEEDRNARFAEAIDHILAIWSRDPPYDIEGTFWTVSTRRNLWPEVGLGAIAKPFQHPHPPILGTVVAPDSRGIGLLGERGWWPISANFLMPHWLPGHWRLYAEGCEKAGRAADPADWRIARSIFVADDETTAKAYGGAAADSPYRFYMSQLSSKIRRGGQLRVFKPDDSMSDDAVTLDHVVDSVVIAGGVSEVVDRILELRETAGPFGTLLYAGKNWTDPPLAKRSMVLMAEKVMPAVNAALGES